MLFLCFVEFDVRILSDDVLFEVVGDRGIGIGLECEAIDGGRQVLFEHVLVVDGG